MSYMPARDVWNDIFAVPKSVVDNHIKLSSASGLKVLLYILRSPSDTHSIQSISSALNLKSEDVSDALLYWEQAGIIVKSDSVTLNTSPDVQVLDISSETPADIPAAEAVPQNGISEHQILNHVKLLSSTPPKLGKKDAAERIKSDAELKFLVDETELRLSRPLTHTDVISLINMHDWAGLPYDVIVTIIEYCVTREKASIRSIEREAIRWADNGITTLDKAEEYIKLKNDRHSAEQSVKRLFGISDRSLTKKEREYIHRWMCEYNFPDEVVKEAYERCIDNIAKLRFSYINNILESWRGKGLKSLSRILLIDPVKAATSKTSENKNDNAKSAPTRMSSKSSLNIESMKQKHLMDIPKYQKKKE